MLGIQQLQAMLLFRVEDFEVLEFRVYRSILGLYRE